MNNNPQLNLPILSPDAIETAIECLDWEETIIVSDGNWSCLDSERLARIHITKKQLTEYSQKITKTLGSPWRKYPEHENTIPLDKEEFSKMVQDLMVAIYGDYMAIIEEDYESIYGKDLTE